MSYTIGDDGLLDLSGCADTREKLDICWEYFEENLSSQYIVAFDGKPVRGFTEKTFNHIVSGSSNKYDLGLGHDIDFVEERARRLPLIAKVIRGEMKSRCYRVHMTGGSKKDVRKVLSVIEMGNEYYIVVMSEVKERYAILTAYPSNRDYFEHCVRARGQSVGIWG